MNPLVMTTRLRSRLACRLACVTLIVLAGCRMVETKDKPAGDRSLSNSGSSAPYVRGQVRRDGTYVRPYLKE